MRSDQIHVAIAQGNNRYEICRLTFKGVHIIHKRGERMEDSINRVLGMLRPLAPAAAVPSIGQGFPQPKTGIYSSSPSPAGQWAI